MMAQVAGCGQVGWFAVLVAAVAGNRFERRHGRGDLPSRGALRGTQGPKLGLGNWAIRQGDKEVRWKEGKIGETGGALLPLFV